jgi:VanZ family protein
MATSIKLRWALVLLVMLAIFVASSLTGSEKPRDAYKGIDKHEHFVAYALLAITLYSAVAASKPGRGPVFALVAACVIATIYGITDEFHQRFVPGREFSLLDWRADAVGASAGAFLMCIIGMIRRRKHE